LASVQFWLANVGLPGMLAGSVLPVGLGLDRIGILFGFTSAAAGILFAVLLSRAWGPLPVRPPRLHDKKAHKE
jgi:hypothetical protein